MEKLSEITNEFIDDNPEIFEGESLSKEDLFDEAYDYCVTKNHFSANKNLIFLKDLLTIIAILGYANIAEDFELYCTLNQKQGWREGFDGFEIADCPDYCKTIGDNIVIDCKQVNTLRIESFFRNFKGNNIEIENLAPHEGIRFDTISVDTLVINYNPSLTTNYQSMTSILNSSVKKLTLNNLSEELYILDSNIEEASISYLEKDPKIDTDIFYAIKTIKINSDISDIPAFVLDKCVTQKLILPKSVKGKIRCKKYNASKLKEIIEYI